MMKQIESINHRLETFMNTAGPHFVHDLIVLFFQLGRQDVEQMKKALAHSSMPEFGDAAYNLKATSFNIGAIQLGSICEHALKEVSKHEATKLLSQIEFEFNQVELFLRSYVSESAS